MKVLDAVFTGVVDEHGALKLDTPRAVKAWLQRFIGHEIELVIRKRRIKRSDKQNRYWHGVVVATLAEHCGYTRDEMHDALKAKFLGTEDLTTGLRRIGSTTKLSTTEFAELTERVMVWAITDLGVVIPPPEKDVITRKKAA